MRTIGLIGGMSWESSLHYYKIINEEVKEKLGGHHSCKCLMHSVDFAEIEKLEHEDRWDVLTGIMIDSARKLEGGGAEILLICANTVHIAADEVQRNINIPLLHIADAVGEQIKREGMQRVGLLGTKFTMEKHFYKDRLKEKYGIDVIIPDEKERLAIHDIIFNELVLGIINDHSREAYKDIINGLVSRGAEGIVLGCTEIPMLLKQQDCEVKLLDTMLIHAKMAVELAIK